MATPYIDDFVVVLSPEGEELHRVSVLEALIDAGYPQLISNVMAIAAAKGDPLHTNTVELVRWPMGTGDASFEEGQVILSMRSLNAIAALDLEKGVVTWAYRGPWVAQHDPDILDNGNILIFDNLGHIGEGGRSRLIEFDPFTLEVVWQYAGDRDNPFYSEVRSRQQKLPNGNVLITESEGGRLFEVTEDKTIVWEFLNPHRRGENGAYTAWITGGQRFGRDELPFLSSN